MAGRKNQTTLPAPFLKRVVVLSEKMKGRSGYPFDLPWLQNGGFDLEFTTPVTIIAGENGTGKSTLTEAIAVLSGYGEAGGSKDHRAVSHSATREKNRKGTSGCAQA